MSNNKEEYIVIVIGEKPSPVAFSVPVTRIEKEKGRVKEEGKDHYYI